MSQVGDTFRVPQFVMARSKIDLVRAMLVNNIKHGMEFDYFAIQREGLNWVAWFRWPVDRKKFLVDEIKRAGNG